MRNAPLAAFVAAEHLEEVLAAGSPAFGGARSVSVLEPFKLRADLRPVALSGGELPKLPVGFQQRPLGGQHRRSGLRGLGRVHRVART